MASNKIESDDEDGLVLRPDYEAEIYEAEEYAMENEVLNHSIERKKQQLNDVRKRRNERIKKENEGLEDQLRIAETESSSSQTKVKTKSPEQEAEKIRSQSENYDFYFKQLNLCGNTSRRPSLISNTYQTIGSAAYASVRSGKCTQNANKRSCAKDRQVQEAETIISHSEDSDIYIEVNSGGSTSRRPSIISDTYQTIGSAAYASVRSGKCTQNAIKRSCDIVRQVQEAETVISHQEDSDFYIEVNSDGNPSRRPSLISDTYESGGSAAYAHVRSGKCTQNAIKRSCDIVRQVQEAETVMSHQEDSDFYIEVNSDGNPSRRPSLISDTYESVGSAAYAHVRPGRNIKNANKRRCTRFRQVLFTVLAMCLPSTVLIVLSVSDDAAITPIKPPCIRCNSTEVNEVNANKTCCDRNSSEMLPEGRMIRSHFISYVDEAFIHELFEAGYNESAVNIVGKEMKEWQGALFRNRTFLMKAGPVRLKFFKEQLNDEADGRLFDFNEITGVFYVKFPGMYSVYANISSFNFGRHSGQPMFVVLHKRKTEMMTAYYRVYSMNCNISVHDNKIKNYMQEIIYLNVGDSVELQSIYEHTLIDLDYGEAYFGGSLVVKTDVE